MPRGDSPAANRRCASARSHGHEEDPRRALIIARRCPMRRRCVVSADRWQVARTPAARLIPASSLANTCPRADTGTRRFGARRTTPCTRHASKSGVPPNAPEHHPLIRHPHDVDDAPRTCHRSPPTCAKRVSPDAPATTRLAVPMPAKWVFTGPRIREQDGANAGSASRQSGIGVSPWRSG